MAAEQDGGLSSSRRVSRGELRALGEEVVARLAHGVVPPRTRPLYGGTVPGMQHYTTEALWGSVWSRPGLDLRARMLLTVSVLGGLQRLPQLRTYLNSAVNLSLDMVAVREALIQCSVFAGFPATVNSLELFRDVAEARGLSVEMEPPAEAGIDALAAMGAAMEQTLHGGSPAPLAARWPGAERPADALRSVEQHFIFGDLFHRPGLLLPERCLCALACAIALGPDAERESWIDACLRVGLDDATVGEAILQCAYYAGFPAAKAAMALLEAVTARPGA